MKKTKDADKVIENMKIKSNLVWGRRLSAGKGWGAVLFCLKKKLVRKLCL